MKAKLTFTLPDERVEFELANNAGVFADTIIELERYCRNQLKYGINERHKTPEDVFQHVRNEISSAYELIG